MKNILFYFLLSCRRFPPHPREAGLHWAYAAWSLWGQGKPKLSPVHGGRAGPALLGSGPGWAGSAPPLGQAWHSVLKFCCHWVMPSTVGQGEERPLACSVLLLSPSLAAEIIAAPHQRGWGKILHCEQLQPLPGRDDVTNSETSFPNARLRKNIHSFRAQIKIFRHQSTLEWEKSNSEGIWKAKSQMGGEWREALVLGWISLVKPYGL